MKPRVVIRMIDFEDVNIEKSNDEFHKIELKNADRKLISSDSFRVFRVQFPTFQDIIQYFLF